jgi:type VI secretion system protein ImpL
MDFRRFLKPPVYIGAGAVGASAATLIVFNILKWSLLLALLVILVLVMVAVIVILIRQLQKAKAADEIEKSVVVQADKDIERSVPGKQAEMQNLKAEFLAAVEKLKSSKRGGKAVLSVLPWYMVVGPSSAGKSVLLGNSGLQFALTDESRRGKAVKGVGGTRSFEWWLTQEAVLLDMTGRMVGASAQFEDTGDWGDFLQVLKRQRPEKPLNGVIVAMPVDQLADRPDAQIEKLASSIRERVQEVIHHLGVVFPVYVVFTKCDLLAGFAEFFSDLGAAERQQPWGATVSVDRSESEAAEALFDGEFGLMQAALADRRMTRLSGIPDPLQRARAFAFPAQMERVRPALRRFVRVLFAEDPTEKDQPLFRGFYFTVGDTVGSPVDRVLEPAARALGVSLGEPPAPPQTPPGAWFVHDLLTGVVFEDAGLVTTSKGAVQAQKVARWITLGVLAVVFLAFVILFSSLSCANGQLIGATRRAASEAATHVRPDATLLDNLESLEDVRKNVAVVDSLRHYGPPWWRALGAWSGNPVRDPALELYTQKSLDALIGPSYDAMQARIDTLSSRFSGEFADFYSMFRSWRLLGTPRDLMPTDAPLVSRVVNRLQADRVRSLSQDVRDRIATLIDAQVAFLCAHPEYLEKRFFPTPAPALVTRGQQTLRGNWDAGSFYRLMIDQTRRFTHPLGVAALTDNARLLSGSAEVPGPFTHDGWEKQVKPRIEWWRAQVARDGDLRDAFGGRTPDLAGSLLSTYATDYTQQWVGLLNGLHAADFGDSRPAGADNMRSMVSDDSPLLALLAGASEQLTFAEDPASPMGKVQAGFAMLHDFAKAPPGGSWGRKVTSGVSGLFKPRSGLNQGGLVSSRYLEQMRGAQKIIADKAAPSAPPTDWAPLFNPGSNPVQTALAWLDQQSVGYPAGPPRDATVRVLRLPVDMFTGKGLPQMAGGRLPAELIQPWTLLLLHPFEKTLMGKYPVTATGPDASLADFIEFFRPGGTFWSFYDANLKAYVTEDGQPAGMIQLPPEYLACVHHAREIRDAFFSANPQQPSLSFAVRTTTASFEGPQVFVRKVHFDVGGQFITYANGVPQWDPVQWPGPDPGVGAALRVEVALGVTAESKSFPGPWGLFHLLDQATWSGSSDAPKAIWRLNAGQSKIVLDYDIQPRATTHPFRSEFLRFNVPSPQTP